MINAVPDHQAYDVAAGFLLYLLDLTFRLAQWMNVSVVTGSLSLHDILTLELSFSPVLSRRPA